MPQAEEKAAMSDMEWRYAFGLRLYHARMAKGMSQRDLGKLVGVHHNTISLYEMGSCEPTAHKFLRICDALKVSADEMLGRGE